MNDYQGRIALDIETISPRLGPNEKPNFTDPNDFEIFIVGLGYESPDGKIENLSAVFRESPTPEGEIKLIEKVIDWIDDHPAEQLVTYNGTRFDLNHLQGRPRLIEGENGPTATDVRQRFTSLVHLDLKPAAWKQFGDYTSLEKLCEYVQVPVEETIYADYDIGCNLDEICSQRDSIVQSRDIPTIGETWLNACAGRNEIGLDTEETRRLLERYTLSDIKPLFRLADLHPFNTGRS